MRTSIVLLVSLLVATLLGGCGGDGGESTIEQQDKADEDTVAVTVPEGGETTSITSLEFEQKAEQARQIRDTKGVSKTGQDISNIPIPEESLSEGKLQCVTDYYNSLSSLPSDQRRQISQQVVEQANAQGVSPADIVGC